MFLYEAIFSFEFVTSYKVTSVLDKLKMVYWFSPLCISLYISFIYSFRFDFLQKLRTKTLVSVIFVRMVLNARLMVKVMFVSVKKDSKDAIVKVRFCI